MPPALKRTAVLVVRVWFEDGAEEGQLRARITQTLDAAVPEGAETSAASSEQEITKAVRAWLRGAIAGR